MQLERPLRYAPDANHGVGSASTHRCKKEVRAVPMGRSSCLCWPLDSSPVKKIAIIVSSPLTVKLSLMDHIEALSLKYAVSLVLNLERGESIPGLSVAVEVITVPIARDISLICDLRALGVLFALFRRARFDAVHSITPKAGLLTALASTIARIPVRVHTFTGQVWATRSGLARRGLRLLDKAIARTATHVLVDSPSQQEFLVREGVVYETQSRVLADGSICGVDTIRFRPEPEWKSRVRETYGIPEGGFVFLFVGRLKRDKGVLDLAQAFSRLGGERTDAWLLIVGPDEEDLQPRIEEICSSVADRVRFVGFTEASQEYMAAADVLCLPSYREGFGSVIIEAASAGIPAVASNIYGIIDAVGPAGAALLHAPGDVDGLQSNMTQMLQNPDLCKRLGNEARARAHRLFNKELITSELVHFYESILDDSRVGDSMSVGGERQSVGIFKRLFDITLAALALLLLSPVLAGAALAVLLVLGRPVLFRQTRPGYLEKPFTILKFRTMGEAVDSHGVPLPDGERLHPLGTFLRRASVDELPELWNVLRGEMSLVGPRPLLMNYLPFFTKEERLRFTVRPGITGWAQVNGRNYSPWTERLSNDVWYVTNRSLLLDVKILWKTVVQVLCARNISVDANKVLQNLNEERTAHPGSTATIRVAPRESV